MWFFVAVLFVALFLLLFTQVCCAWDCLQMGSGIVPASKVRAITMHTSTDNILGHPGSSWVIVSNWSDDDPAWAALASQLTTGWQSRLLPTWLGTS